MLSVDKRSYFTGCVLSCDVSHCPRRSGFILSYAFYTVDIRLLIYITWEVSPTDFRHIFTGFPYIYLSVIQNVKTAAGFSLSF